MTDTRTTAYAEALLAIARAEGETDRVTDELIALGQAVESDEQLRSTLADSRLPAERRAQVIEDVLAGKALQTTIATASMVVAAGSGAVVAEARSAVALTDDQVSRLTEALTSKLGRPVKVRNIVDPTVIGGVVTQIGDEVIDGSVRTRLNQLREAF